MRFFILFKKENFREDLINDTILNSVNATSLIAEKCIKKDLNNMLVYLYTYNMAYNEEEGYSYKISSDEIKFVHGLFSVEDYDGPNSLETYDYAINNDKLILGNYQYFYFNKKGDGYFDSSLSTIHPLFLYEDEYCSVISNELKLIVDGVNKFQAHKFVEFYDVKYMEDLLQFGTWASTDEKTTYRSTAFKNIKRVFPFDDVKIENNQLKIKYNSQIQIPNWIEELYLKDKDAFYDWYYKNLVKYCDNYLRLISSQITQINVGITGGFDSRLTLMILKELISKYDIKLQSFTDGLEDHPDVIIGRKVAEYLNVDWKSDEEDNKLKYFPSSFKEYATTFYISQGDFDSHDTTDVYTREYVNKDQFTQLGNDLYKRDTINKIINISRWSSRRRLFKDEFYFPLFGTCIEIWLAFLISKYSDDGYKDFIYHLLKRGNSGLLEIPFANDYLPQTNVEEFKVEGYVGSRHKEEPFLWDYNYILDKLGPIFNEEFMDADAKFDSILSEAGINSLDYFILKKDILTIIKQDLDRKKTKSKLKNLKNKSFYPKSRDLIDQKKYKRIYSFIRSIFLMDFAVAADFNSFESLEKACSFNYQDDSLDLIDEHYKKINALKSEIGSLEKELARLKKENKKIKKQIKEYKRANEEMASSKTWKLSSVFRKNK